MLELDAERKLKQDLWKTEQISFPAERTVKQLEVNLTEPLQYLFSKIQSHSEMLHFATVTQALQQMIERIQLEMTTLPDYHVKSFDQLHELTKPILINMRTIRPRKRFNATTNWQLTIIFGVILIMISNLLQFAPSPICIKEAK